MPYTVFNKEEDQLSETLLLLFVLFIHHLYTQRLSVNITAGSGDKRSTDSWLLQLT